MQLHPTSALAGLGCELLYIIYWTSCCSDENQSHPSTRFIMVGGYLYELVVPHAEMMAALQN